MTTSTLTNVETFTPIKLNSKFRRGPSKTRLEDLKIGKREYQARTVEEMKANKVSCKDLREFHESQGNYYEKAFTISFYLFWFL